MIRLVVTIELDIRHAYLIKYLNIVCTFHMHEKKDILVFDSKLESLMEVTCPSKMPLYWYIFSAILFLLINFKMLMEAAG